MFRPYFLWGKMMEEIVLDEQDESDYETDGDDIDLESISKIVAETYSPSSAEL